MNHIERRIQPILDVLSYFWTRHWTWHLDLLNRESGSRFPMNNCSGRKRLRLPSEQFFIGKWLSDSWFKNLNATFNVGGKSNWVRLMLQHWIRETTQIAMVYFDLNHLGKWHNRNGLKNMFDYSHSNEDKKPITVGNLLFWFLILVLGGTLF